MAGRQGSKACKIVSHRWASLHRIVTVTSLKVTLANILKQHPRVNTTVNSSHVKKSAWDT